MVNTRTWDGGGADDNWSTAGNWSGDTAPVAGDNVIFDGATSNDPCTVDLVAGVFGTLTVYGNYTGTITLAVAIEFGAGDIGNTSASNLTFSGDYTVIMTTLNLDTSDTLTMASSANLTLTSTFTCDGTLTPSAGSVLTFGGTVTITGVLGVAATAFTIDMNATLATSSGQLIAPKAPNGSFLFSGATWNTPTTFTSGTYVTTFDLAGTTTLANDSIQFYKIYILSGAVLDTNSVNNYALTVLSISTAVIMYGTLYLNNSAFSTGQIQLNSSSVVRGSAGSEAPTGNHTIGACYFPSSLSVFNFTSGTVNANNDTGGAWLQKTAAATINHNNGTINFTLAAVQHLYDTTNTALTLYNITITKTLTNTLCWANGGHFALTIAGALILTSGIFSTITTTSGISNNITVTGTSSITGTLTTNTSTIITTGLVTVNTGGTFGGNTAYTWNINGGVTNSGGTINSGTGTVTLAASKTFANTTGTVNINGGNFWGTSSTTSIVTSGGTWNWATVNIKLLDFQFAITSGAYTLTASGNIQTDAVTVSVSGTLAIVSYTFTVDGTFSNSGATTFTTGTAVLNSTLAIPAGTFGSATAYTLDLNGNLLASVGTLIAPTVSGTFTFSGATMNLPTTYTHSDGLITFDLAGAQSITYTGDGTIYNLTIALDSTTTITKKIVLSGSKTGAIISDQISTGILYIHNLIITGTLHAKYGGAYNSNASHVIQIIMYS